MKRIATSMAGPAARATGIRAFSLVEVVMALGIFSFAIVAIIALFSGVSKNTRALVDRDAMVAVWQSLSTGITGMSSINIFAIPSGTASSGRPEIFARAVQPGGATNAMSVEIQNSVTLFTNTQADGRLYRARLYRALSGTNEAPWLTNQAYYPLRVQVDVFASDAYSSTNQPIESTTFNLIWNAH